MLGLFLLISDLFNRKLLIWKTQNMSLCTCKYICIMFFKIVRLQNCKEYLKEKFL